MICLKDFRTYLPLRARTGILLLVVLEQPSSSPAALRSLLQLLVLAMQSPATCCDACGRRVRPGAVSLAPVRSGSLRQSRGKQQHCGPWRPALVLLFSKSKILQNSECGNVLSVTPGCLEGISQAFLCLMVQHATTKGRRLSREYWYKAIDSKQFSVFNLFIWAHLVRPVFPLRSFPLRPQTLVPWKTADLLCSKFQFSVAFSVALFLWLWKHKQLKMWGKMHFLKYLYSWRTTDGLQFMCPEAFFFFYT